MKVHIVIETVYGNEGSPDVWAFIDEDKAKAQEDALNEEYDEDNENVLVIRKTVEVQ